MRTRTRTRVMRPWPTSSTTVIPISGPSIGMARSMLATLLTGATAPDRATMSLRWGVNYVSHISTGLVDGQFFAADGLTNSSYWASAGASAQREKRSNADITITGGDAPASASPSGSPVGIFIVSSMCV